MPALSHRSMKCQLYADVSPVGPLRAYDRRSMSRAALVFAALAVLSAPACAAIYKWTDDTGRTVYSNRPPAKASLAKEAKVVIEDDAAPAPSEVARDEAARRERELAERIASLERQLAARQYAPAPYYPPAAPPAPSAPPDYFFSGSYYPYAPYVAYPAVAIIRPVHRFGRPFPLRPLPAFHHRHR
jgi:Domain of unknown function (DUF4124)